MTKSKKTKLPFIVMLLAIAFAISSQVVFAGDCDEIEDEDERKECEEKEKKLEDKKDDLEDKKDDIQDDLKKAEKQKNELQQNLTVIQQSLLSAQASLNETQQEIESKEQEIERQNKQVDLLNQKNELLQKALSSTLRNFYYKQQNKNTFLALLDSKNSEEFGLFSDTSNLGILQGKINDLMNDINETKSVIEEEKKKVEVAIEEKKDLYSLKQKQEQTLHSEKVQTQGQIVKKEATISELNAKLAEVESDLSGLLGKSVDADDIVEAAEIASKKTGVRKSFILGMLVVETNLGRYTGGCTYKDSNMGTKNTEIFKRICKDLGYNYKKKKVSCSLSYGIGGAMGVSQFMPTTWAGYEAKVEKYTGHSPADPWSLTDGVMAMAIKLANDGATKKSGEDTAARRYYCGSNLSRTVCKNYADKVLYWAENYKDRL